MISIEKIYHDIRAEGFNAGTPMTFVKVGFGSDYEKAEDLVSDIMKLVMSNRWVCVVAEEATGLGTLIKDLRTCQLRTEVCCSGTFKDPGWLHSADRWCIDHVEGGTFNYLALRGNDMLRFTINGLEDLPALSEYLKDFFLLTGLKIIKLTSSSKELRRQAIQIAGKFDKVRIY